MAKDSKDSEGFGSLNQTYCGYFKKNWQSCFIPESIYSCPVGLQCRDGRERQFKTKKGQNNYRHQQSLCVLLSIVLRRMWKLPVFKVTRITQFYHNCPAWTWVSNFRMDFLWLHMWNSTFLGRILTGSH